MTNTDYDYFMICIHKAEKHIQELKGKFLDEKNEWKHMIDIKIGIIDCEIYELNNAVKNYFKGDKDVI